MSKSTLIIFRVLLAFGLLITLTKAELLCNEFPGYRCVSHKICLSDDAFVTTPEDEDDVVDEVFGVTDEAIDVGGTDPRSDSSRPRTILDDIECSPAVGDIRNSQNTGDGEFVCCQETNIVPLNPGSGEPVQDCPSDTHGCVDDEQCDPNALIAKKFGLCQLTHQTCCHKGAITDQSILQDCPRDTHNVVASSRCKTERLIIRDFDTGDEKLTCCLKSQTIATCSDFKSDGYTCGHCPSKSKAYPDDVDEAVCVDDGGQPTEEECCSVDDVIARPKVDECPSGTHTVVEALRCKEATLTEKMSSDKTLKICCLNSQIEADPDDCILFGRDGFSCTEKEECQKGPGSMNYPDRVTNALCVDPDTTQIIPSQTCCHSDDIAKFTPDNCDSATHVVVETELCNIKKLGPRTTHVCCLKSQVQKEDPDLCVDYKDQGYSCVKKSSCQPGIGSPPRPRDILNSICKDPRSDSSAEDDEQVCCHQDDVAQPAVECSIFAKDEFKCVDVSECLDPVLLEEGQSFSASTRSASLETSLRQSNFDPNEVVNVNPSLAICPEKTSVCCHTVKPPEVPPTNPDGENCDPGFECIPLKNCKAQTTSSVSILIDPRSDATSLRIDNRGQCKSDLEICCRKSRGIDKPPTTVVTLPPTTATTPPTVALPNITVPTYIPKCGQHNPEGVGLNINNPIDAEIATQFGEWPHTCLLLEVRQNVEFFAGGASLIARGIVLTGATKVKGIQAERLLVRCGEWDTQSFSEPRKEQTRKVKEIVVHPRFDVLEYNYAVLILEEEFKLNKHIDTICLPDKPDLRDGQYIKEGCVATGWGKTNFESDQYQTAMKQVKLPIVDNPVCQKQLRLTELGFGFRLHKADMCAGGKTEADTCEGDGGGPLVCQHPRDTDRYVLAGITSAGIGCGRINVPGVYAAVPDGLCFIHWATRCKVGRKYSGFYNYPDCDNWIEKEIVLLTGGTGNKAALAKAKALQTSCVGRRSGLE